MGLRVNNNVAAMNSYRNLTTTESQMTKSLEKLSSGFRINRAADDAAGLAISEQLRSQVGGLKVAQRNAQDGISVIQTAEGALTEVHSLLQRVRDLSVQAANTGANDATSREQAAKEVASALTEIDRIAQATKFGGKQLLNGTTTTDGTTTTTVAAQFTFQVGSEADAVNQIKVDINPMNVAGLALNGTAVATDDLAELIKAGDTSAITRIDTAITAVSSQRGDLGAAQNRLEHTIANLAVTTENLSASESRIRDTDMAQEMTNYTRSQILVQAGTAMLAQANSSSQNVLSLLRG